MVLRQVIAQESKGVFKIREKRPVKEIPELVRGLLSGQSWDMLNNEINILVSAHKSR